MPTYSSPFITSNNITHSKEQYHEPVISTIKLPNVSTINTVRPSPPNSLNLRYARISKEDNGRDTKSPTDQPQGSLPTLSTLLTSPVQSGQDAFDVTSSSPNNVTSSPLNQSPSLSSVHDCVFLNCRRVIINVSGQRFETQLRTLCRYPTSLLGNPLKRARYWDRRCSEYFFDRHRPSFQAILYFYQSGGRLRRPPEIPEDVFLDEVIFYELGADTIATYREKEHLPIRHHKVLPDSPWRRRLWLFTEMPSSGIFATIFAVASVVVVLTSVVNFCVETLPQFGRNSCPSFQANSTRTNDNEKFIPDSSQSSSDVIEQTSLGDDAFAAQTIYSDIFFQIEAATVVWFTLELLLRFIACPTKRSYIRDVVNLFDIVAVFPFYVFLILQYSAPEERYCESIRKSGIYIILRLLRVLRIFKLAKHSRGLRILGRTIQTSLHELWVFTFFLLVGTVIYSAFVYHAESVEPNAQITSIPAGFWWAIITLTTVGYGDVTPVGMWGRLVGSVCVITGVLTVALPVPIIVANFNAIYRHEIRQGKIGREGREYMEGRGHVDAQGRR